jgi:hypothetical protein
MRYLGERDFHGMIDREGLPADYGDKYVVQVLLTGWVSVLLEPLHAAYTRELI